MNRKFDIAEDVKFPELRHRINAVIIRIPTAFITDMQSLFRNSECNAAVPEQPGNLRRVGLTLPNLKASFNAMVSQSLAKYWCGDRYTDQYSGQRFRNRATYLWPAKM